MICIECICDHSGHEFVRKEESSNFYEINRFSLYTKGECRKYSPLFGYSGSKNWKLLERRLELNQRHEVKENQRYGLDWWEVWNHNEVIIVEESLVEEVVQWCLQFGTFKGK